jgi:hypothetical protein
MQLEVQPFDLNRAEGAKIRVLVATETHGCNSVGNHVFYLQPTPECWFLLKHTGAQ